MELPKDLKDEIWNYCRLNDITNVDDFIIKMIRSGFTSDKFGSTPWEKPAEIKEVEKIVEKEVIKEVEVEKIVEVIKEVEVEKEVFVTDDEANVELHKKLDEAKRVAEHNEETLNKEMLHLITENKKKDDKIETVNRKITDLEGQIKQLEEELETEKNKPKEEDNDIYGEKKGFLGSNISDLWNKKKQ